MTIGDYLGRRALYSPEKMAIVDAGKDPAWRLTYAAMNERANRPANRLRDEAAVGYGGRLAPYKVPERVDFREDLPISGADKILKRELRAEYVPEQ